MLSSDVPPYIGVAADSNAALFVNGVQLSRKVTRYKETNITYDRVLLPRGLLMEGVNTVVIRHFSWGDIETFQRTGEKVDIFLYVMLMIIIKEKGEIEHAYKNMI